MIKNITLEQTIIYLKDEIEEDSHNEIESIKIDYQEKIDDLKSKMNYEIKEVKENYKNCFKDEIKDLEKLFKKK